MTADRMRVLVACESSGVVRDAFRARGHDAMSCDLLPSDDGSPFHIQGDMVDLLVPHRWDLIIMHPPCTALCVSGNRWYGKGRPKHGKRLQAVAWTVELWERAISVCSRVCMENPVGVLPMKATQWVQPWQFGHGETKRTGFWLHGLAPLMPTDVVDGREQRIWKLGPSADRWKIRSKTFQGIVDAMADQWSNDNNNEER